MKRLTLSAATAVITLSIAGCDRRETATPPPATPSASSVASIAKEDTVTIQKAATPNDFSRAAKHLDIGGNFLIYWSVDQVIAQTKAAADDLKEMAKTEADSDSEKEKFEKGWSFLGKLVTDSGALAVESVSASAIELEPKMFRAKSFISRKPGSKGLIWEFPGKAPHEQEFLKMLPADTAFCQIFDYDIRKIWNNLNDAVKEIPEASGELAKVPAEFEKSTGIAWDKYLDESGGEVVIALTLNAAKELEFPVPDAGNIKVPEPGLIIAFRMKGKAVFDRLETLTKEMPRTESERDGAKLLVGPTGDYEGLRYGPTLTQSGEWLILTSREDVMFQILDAKSGKGPSLSQNADFQRLMKHAPAKANGLTYLGKNLSQALQSIQLTAVQSEELNQITTSMKKRIVDLLRLPEKLVTVQFGDDGIVVTEVGESAIPSSSLAGPAAFLLPVAVAAGIPYYMNQRLASQTISEADADAPFPIDILNEARLLDAATDQWAIESNQQMGAAIEFETIKAYIKPSSRVFNSGGLDAMGNPFIFNRIGDPEQVQVNPVTKEYFKDSVDENFWKGY